ncbi:MAG: LysM peptidoglycan-binding domain-containing M23 family metallopeptidase [Candidatus Omnitrophica bacterium]|jgi:lipoprotein YgeR|nr:LysM peptidoglycan-binding domain-containing M23 family metallopeptidase [Candidatus Omnitrophota bacterium]
MKLTFLFLIIIVLVSCSSARIISDQSQYLPSSREKISYIVKKGDSLWKISKNYGVSVERIMRENNISSTHNLKVGQRIFIPNYYRPSENFHRTSGSGNFLWPVQGKVINFFAENVENTANKGLNIKVNSSDKKVIASSQGKVVFASDLKGWGKTIILQHSSNLYTIYANLNDILIKEGFFVKKGQTIGEVACGKNSNYILHFEIRKNHLPQNPLSYLN